MYRCQAATQAPTTQAPRTQSSRLFKNLFLNQHSRASSNSSMIFSRSWSRNRTKTLSLVEGTARSLKKNVTIKIKTTLPGSTSSVRTMLAIAITSPSSRSITITLKSSSTRWWTLRISESSTLTTMIYRRLQSLSNARSNA